MRELLDEPVQDLTAEQREQIILDHLPQVRLIARRIHERLPEHIHLDDLISAGTLGLIRAVDNFDSSQNVLLKTYAEYRIRGPSWTACAVWTSLPARNGGRRARLKPLWRVANSASDVPRLKKRSRLNWD